mgnify:CR=1 FL=1
MLIGHWLSNVMICNMFIIYSYVIVILKAQKSPSPPVYYRHIKRIRIILNFRIVYIIQSATANII